MLSKAAISQLATPTMEPDPFKKTGNPRTPMNSKQTPTQHAEDGEDNLIGNAPTNPNPETPPSSNGSNSSNTNHKSLSKAQDWLC